MRRLYSKVDVSPHSYERYLFDLVMSSENEFSLSCERTGREAAAGRYLKDIAMKDIEVIRGLFALAPHFNIFSGSIGDTAARFISQAPDELVCFLAGEYHTRGCGALYGSQAFMWDGGAVKVGAPDDISFDSLIGYERQKGRIISNTKAFAAGKPYNNILLFGDRGTGKSSCVKAAFNMFRGEGIRIIELPAGSITHIRSAMEFMRSRGFKFILFLDDLSFEENEYGFRELKAQLEGSLERQPDNVVIYATSNRFHIVKENISDNAGISNEIHLNDTIQEKLSLSDRFGITITFDTPGPEEYLHIAGELLAREGMYIDPDILREQAYRWELSNHGRSGRSASQFVKAVAGGMDGYMDITR
jgi:predicted AAA+ superfamily ATPase